MYRTCFNLIINYNFFTMKKNILFAITLIFLPYTLFSKVYPQRSLWGMFLWLVLLKTTTTTYINFPKPNTIIKKGGQSFYLID